MIVVDFRRCFARGVNGYVEDGVCDGCLRYFGIVETEDDEGQYLLALYTEGYGSEREACATHANMFHRVRRCAVVRTI